MTPKNLASRKRRPQEDVARADCDSQSGAAAKEAAAPLRKQPPRKPKFASPFKQPEPEPVGNGSACSSPSASGFIVVPRGEREREREREREKEKKMKKSSASKLFSDDDEIALLKGLAVFWADGRNNKWAEFHLSVKDDLGKHFTKIQLSEKIRTLKRKFDKNLARANEGEIDLSDPHESALFELSKALWGDDKGIALEKAPEKEQMSENGDMEVKGQMGESENGDNEVKGQIGENGNDEVNEILTGTEQVVENDGSKKKKKKKKNRKQVGAEGEPNKEMTNREQGFDDSFEEGDLHDAANTILSIRKLLNEHVDGNKESKVDGEGNKESEVDGEGNKELKVAGEGNKESEVYGEGNKKSRKKKRKREIERDEEKELVNERMQVDGQDEGNKDGERNKNKKKTKLVEECGEANKVAGEQKEVDEHAAKVKISEEVNRVEQHDDEEEEEELLKQGKQVDEHEQQDKKSKKRKRVGGHDLKKDLAKQGKQVDDHAEEHNIPAKGKQEMGIRVDDFQSAYPLLYASYNISGYPKVPMDKCVLIGRENAQEFELKWCELKAEEHRLELKRIELMLSRGKRS